MTNALFNWKVLDFSPDHFMRQRTQESLKEEDHWDFVDRVLPFDGLGVAEDVSESDPGENLKVFKTDFLRDVCEYIQDEVLFVSLQRFAVKKAAEVVYVALDLRLQCNAQVDFLQFVEF